MIAIKPMIDLRGLSPASLTAPTSPATTLLPYLQSQVLQNSQTLDSDKLLTDLAQVAGLLKTQEAQRTAA